MGGWAHNQSDVPDLRHGSSSSALHAQSDRQIGTHGRVLGCTLHRTRREREVLDLVLAGLLNKEIALHLAISQRTVELHRFRIMQKLHAESAVDLARQVFWAQGT